MLVYLFHERLFRSEERVLKNRFGLSTQTPTLIGCNLLTIHRLSGISRFTVLLRRDQRSLEL